MSATVKYKSNPAMFRNHPFGFMLAVLLCFILVGFLILLLWKIKVMGTVLVVTDECITLRRGLFSKYTNSLYHSDVRNIQIKQSAIQRFLGVGTIGVASAGSGDMEIIVSGMPQPEKIRSIINQFRQKRSL